MGIPAFSSMLQFGTNAVLPLYGRYQADKAAREEAEADAALQEAMAAKKDREAEDAVKIGYLDQADQIRKGRQDIAGQRVRYAASGVKVDSGSALAVTADTAAWNEHERQRIEYEANLESWGLKYDAALLRSGAKL